MWYGKVMDITTTTIRKGIEKNLTLAHVAATYGEDIAGCLVVEATTNDDYVAQVWMTLVENQGGSDQAVAWLRHNILPNLNVVNT